MPADPQQFEATLREVQRDRERYTAWLQLPPPEELPEPTCYDLLGLTPATANAARARQSCTERTKTVRSYQGVYPTEVQRVRSHLEQAARILSERADRAAYDRWLSERAEAVRQERVEQLAGYVDVAVDQENTVTVTRQDRLRAQARKLGLTPADADALLTARSVRVVPDRPVRAQLEEALDLVVVDGAVTETHRDKLRSQAGKIGLTEADADAVLKARSVHVVPDRRRRRAKPVPTPASRPTRKEVSPAVAALVIIMVMVIISATYLLLGRSKKTAATDPESTKTQVSKSAPPTPAPAARQPTSQPANQARPPDNAKKGDTRTNPIDGAVMVFVPAGEFLRGSTDADSEADDDEKPQRRVYLDAYWIDQTEVTNEQYGKFLARILQSKDHSKCHPDEPENKDHTPSGSSWNDPKWNGPKQPVVGVDWWDATAYAAWAGKRLPTEAEWEKAARGTDGRKYPWGNQWDGSKCNTSDGGPGVTTPVGNYRQDASPYGCYDMAGNVWEWCADWYEEGYYRTGPVRNPTGPESGSARVLRGGAWGNGPRFARCANRIRFDPAYRDVFWGFRGAQSPP